MRIRFDQVSFVVPEGFEDETIYEFRNESRQEELMVDCGILPPETQDLTSLVAARRAEIEPALISLTGRFFTDEQSIQIGNLPGYLLTYTFAYDEKQICSRVALSVTDFQSYVELTYITPETHDSFSIFNHILKSVSLMKENEQWSDASKGYVRRQANCICLDVPEYLRPVSTYHFTSSDRQVRFQLTFWDKYQDATSTPSIEEEIAINTRYGADIYQQESHLLQTKHGELMVIDYIEQIEELPEELKKEAVRYARFKLTDEMRITLIGRSSIDKSDLMKNEFINFINNMEVTS